MAKYVCDFDAVKDASSRLETLATEMETAVKASSTDLDSNLVSWSGEASEAFKSSSETISQKLLADATNMKNFSTYLKDAAAKIEEAETTLAAIKI